MKRIGNLLGRVVLIAAACGFYALLLNFYVVGMRAVFELFSAAPAHAATFSGDPCQTAGARKLSVDINDSASGETQLIAGVAGEQIYICSFPFDLNGTNATAEFDEGTGSSCGTGTAALAGPFTSGKQPSAGATQFTVGDGESVCLDLGGSSPRAGGVITFVQQ